MIEGASLCSRADTIRSSELLSRPPGPPKWLPLVLLVLPIGDLGPRSAAFARTILEKSISMFEILPLISSSACQVGR